MTLAQRIIAIAAALGLASAAAGQGQTITKPGTLAPNTTAVQGCHGDPRGCVPIDISGTISTAGAADTIGVNATFNANSVCATVAIAGQTGAGFFLGSGSPVATFTPSVSKDNSNWTPTSFVDVSGNTSPTIVNPSGYQDPGLVVRAGDRYARVCTTAYTSGSAVGFLVATTAAPRPPAAGADVTDRAGRLLGIVYGSDGFQIKTANSGRLQVDVVSGGGSNASIGANGSAAPSSSTQVGGSDYGTGCGGGPCERAAKIDSSGLTHVAVDSGGGSTDVAIHDNGTPTQHLGINGSGQAAIQNPPNLDAATSTLATQATLAAIKAKTDNLDVLLSSRTKPADTQTVAGSVSDQHTDVTADYDTGGGTQILTMFGVGLPKSGGAVAGGTLSDPLRVDPTGTTPQPVTASSLPLPAGAATEATLALIKTDVDKIPASPAQEHTTAGSPSSVEISFGGAFIDPRAIRALTASDVVSAAQSGTWTTGRTWSLLNSTDSVNAVQSGAWSTGRTWSLGSGGDSVSAVLSQYTPVSGRLPVDGSGITQPVQAVGASSAFSGIVVLNPATAAVALPSNAARQVCIRNLPQSVDVAWIGSSASLSQYNAGGYIAPGEEDCESVANASTIFLFSPGGAAVVYRGVN